MAELRGSFKIEGLSEVLKALRTLPKELQEKELAKTTGAAARIIRDDARARAPVLQTPTPYRKSGTLKRFIRSTSGKRNRYVSNAYVYVKTLTGRQISRFKAAQKKSGRKANAAHNPDDPFYWRFVEFGTSKMPARPFLRPAFDERKHAAAEKLRDALRKAVDRAARRVAAPRRGKK